MASAGVVAPKVAPITKAAIEKTVRASKPLLNTKAASALKRRAFKYHFSMIQSDKEGSAKSPPRPLSHSGEQAPIVLERKLPLSGDGNGEHSPNCSLAKAKKKL